MVEKPNPTDVEAVKEKLKNGELKVVGLNSKSKPKAKETKSPSKKQNPESKRIIEEPKTSKISGGDQRHQPRLLIELNEEIFLKAMRGLGGKSVTTSQLWPYFIAANTKPQQRFPIMHRFARKMEKAGKITITANPERKRLQYMYTLPTQARHALGSVNYHSNYELASYCFQGCIYGPMDYGWKNTFQAYISDYA